MSKTAFVLSGRNGLDQFAFRANVVRIPEVSLRIREAQSVLDELDAPRLDLLTFIASDDEFFLRNIKLKSLATAVVQVGLYDRALKQPRRPDLIVGVGNGDSALAVITGRISFRKLIETSAAIPTLRPAERLVAVSAAEATPLLAGISLTEYEAVSCRADGTFESLHAGSMDLTKLMTTLIAEGTTTLVNIGPGQAISARDLPAAGVGDVQVLDSIEMDPMLGWFWRAVRSELKALAN